MTTVAEAPAQAPVSAVPAPAKVRLHLDYLDGIRALAALVVAISHVHVYIWPYGMNGHHLAPGLCGLLTNWLHYSHFAVGLFIVVSGFCLMLPVARSGGFMRDDVLTFYRRRARRILPPYYASLVLCLVLIKLLIGRETGTYWDLALGYRHKDILLHVLMLHDFVGNYLINFVFWSIALEFHIYFAFPILVKGYRRFGAWPTTAAAVLIGYLAYEVVRRLGFSETRTWFLGLFALGMLGATIAYSEATHWQRLRRRLPWLPIAASLSLLLILVCRHLGPEGVAANMRWVDALVGLASAALLIAASLPGDNRLQKGLSWRPLVWIGGFSYSLYLIHAPLIQIVWQYIIHPLHLAPVPSFLVLAMVAMPVSVLLSYLFYLRFEKPFIGKRA